MQWEMAENISPEPLGSHCLSEQAKAQTENCKAISTPPSLAQTPIPSQAFGGIQGECELNCCCLLMGLLEHISAKREQLVCPSICPFVRVPN